MTTKAKPPADGRLAAKRDHKCPECGIMFTEKGLPGHRAFKHQVKLPAPKEAGREANKEGSKEVHAPGAGAAAAGAAPAPDAGTGAPAGSPRTGTGEYLDWGD